MKRKIFSAVKYVLFLVAGVGLLWLVLKGQDFQQIKQEFLKANYFWILPTFLFGFLSHLTRALRWNLLIGHLGYETKTSTTFYAVMVGYFANYAIPRLGEVTRCGVLSRQNKIPLNTLIGTVVAERAFDFICLMVIVVLTVLFQMSFIGDFVDKYVLMPIGDRIANNMLTLVGLGLVVIVLGGGAVFLLFTFREKVKKMPFYTKIVEIIRGFVIGLRTIAQIKKKWLFLFHTVFMWLMYYLMVYFVFFTMKGTSHLTPADALTLLVMGSLGIVAPVPGGIGAYHALVILTMVELYGLSREVATSFAFISHTSQTLLIIVLGVISLLLLLVQKRQLSNAKT